jgi:hypothetical protein
LASAARAVTEYNFSMSDTPQRDWAYFETISREYRIARLRNMSPEEKFVVYADMYNTIWNARQKLSLDRKRLDASRWEQKRAIRVRLAEAFAKLDELNRVRATSKYTD